MTVAFKELSGSPSETFAPEGMAARRRILVAWEDRFSMLVELLGTGGSGYPACPYALVMRAAVEPWPPTPDEQGAFDEIASQLNSYGSANK
jgi:hypothetical protein